MARLRREFGTRFAFREGVAKKAGQDTLKITIQETDKAIEIKLEGRIAGPWVAELSRIWLDIQRRLSDRALSLDLRDVTYSDARGKQLLQDIYRGFNPQLVTSTPWTQYLAEAITEESEADTYEEARDGNHA